MTCTKIILALGQIVLLTSLILETATTKGEFFESSTKRQNLSTQCSETLNEVAGQISYPGGFAPNHRCFWVIRVENATGYKISVEEFASRHIVSFTGFNHVNLADTEQYIVNNLTNEVFEFNNSNLVIVALETDYLNSAFGISYVATFSEGANGISVGSGDYFCDTTERNDWYYPTGDLSTRTYTLSTFIVTPPQNTVHPRLMMDFGIARDPSHHDMDCDWAFYSYFFEAGNLDNSIPTWDSALATCEHPYFSGLLSTEPLLFIFYTESDNRNVTFDFTFYSYYYFAKDGNNKTVDKKIKYSS